MDNAVVREELLKIYRSNNEVLTPALVVETARDPEHPLHQRFEWDDEVAGEKYRKEQARKLIRVARITYAEGSETVPARSVRAFHSVPTGTGRVFQPAEKVARDPVLTELVLKEMERDWKTLRRRYGDMEDFWKLVQRDAESQQE